MNSEKLQKVLARAGLASRREIERWISEGRIAVNGKTAQLGDRITAAARIRVDGRLVNIAKQRSPSRLIAYHKRVGEICTQHDPQRRETVFQQLPKCDQGRWISVGRLDINTSGLLLFTNDGELANRLMHPSANLAREYAVRVHGDIDSDGLKHLTQGVILPDWPNDKVRFEHIVAKAQRGSNRWFYVVVMQGRHRLVRKLWQSQGVQVSRLVRVRFGPILLQGLRPGQWREESVSAFVQE